MNTKNNWLIKNKCFVFCLLISIFLGGFVEKFIFPNEAFIFDRFLFVVLISGLTLFYFFCKNKSELKDFIYRKRYPLAILLFLLLITFGYHGSSINIYNDVIQPNNHLNGTKIFGKDLVIRGDEWIVNSTSMISQKHNNFNANGDILTGTMRNLQLFPKVATKTISILGNLNFVGYLFLPITQAYSFYWYIGYFALFFATFELFMIFTKKRNVSLTAAVMITFASSVQWWEAWNIIAYGELAVVFFYKFLNSNKLSLKILYSILIGIMGASYVFCLYPAWMIPYAYFFLVVVIWMFIQNKSKIKIFDLILLILITFAVMAAILVPTFIASKDVYLYTTNTSYPGSRLSVGGSGWQGLFNYFTNLFTPYVDASNPCEMSQFLSFFPIPIVIGIVQTIINFKNKKHDFLLTGLTILALLLIVWNFIELPVFVAKITLIYMSTIERCIVSVSFICLCIFLIWLGNYAKDSKMSIWKLILSVLYVIFGVSVVKNIYPEYMTMHFMIIDIVLFSLLSYFILVNNVKINKYLYIILILCVLAEGAFVHPINKGVSVFISKPLSYEIDKINSEDRLWAAVETPYYLQNYLTACGAKTINSTNYYPNFELWDKIDADRKYVDIYNRYAHMTVNIADTTSSVELKYMDHIVLNISNKDVCKVGINTIVTESLDISNKSDRTAKYIKIYDNDGIFIYNVLCS